MADILQRYGIKEVADVTFYHINENTNEPDYPVLVLDSLKVTSIEQTAETAEARGGKGNAKLIVWDFGKEINITIEDALFSPKSLAIMFSDGKVRGQGSTNSSEYGVIKRSARIVAQETPATSTAWPEVKIDGTVVCQSEVKHTVRTATGTTVTDGIGFYKNGDIEPLTDAVQINKGDVLFADWLHPVKSKAIITIKPDSFPGTYYVTGDTMIRSERNGEDSYFQFVIPKAKMQAEQTIELQADGDPTTFNMSLQVLRPENGEMFKFIKYEFVDTAEEENEEFEYRTDFDTATSGVQNTVTTDANNYSTQDGWKAKVDPAKNV